jgi:gamma-glutamylputrescine oxidase
MLSYWEQESFIYYDYIITGSGIVGLNTAIELKQRYPAQRVLVLERSLFPYGASTRNAGFACMGSLTELLDDLEHMSAAETVALFKRRGEGLGILRKRLGDAHIGYRERGSHELIAPGDIAALERIDELNTLLVEVTGKPAFRLANEKIQEFGFPASQVEALVEATCEGELHTGKMMRALIDFALQLGIEIKTGVTVQGFEEEEQEVQVQVSDGIREDVLRLKCAHLFICTNAFTPKLLPGTDVQPGRGQVLITEPMNDIPFRGVFHFDKGYYYFREIDNRVLFGGGRNLDFEGETTTTITLQEKIQQDLEEKLRNLILPGRAVTIAQRWSGIMAFGKSKQPIVQSFGARVHGGFRMGGMGVALGASVAQKLAELIPD